MQTIAEMIKTGPPLNNAIVFRQAIVAVGKGSFRSIRQDLSKNCIGEHE